MHSYEALTAVADAARELDEALKVYARAMRGHASLISYMEVARKQVALQAALSELRPRPSQQPIEWVQPDPNAPRPPGPPAPPQPKHKREWGGWGER